jgi:mRNA interferase RelE/StbE
VAFAIVFAPLAARQFKRLDARGRSLIRDAVEAHLRHEPRLTSRSRIKRLRGLVTPEYRLRVEEWRVYYDVVGAEVHVLAVVSKEEGLQWLQQSGVPDEEGGSL